MTHVGRFLDETIDLLRRIDRVSIDQVADELVAVRERGGRLFIIGSGGGAGHASHAVNDFRKIAGIEAYTPTDNVSELTARINDEGWETSYSNWLLGSRFASIDLLLVFSVGGGDAVKKVSVNLVKCVDLAVSVGAPICGIVGRDGGYTARMASAHVLVPTGHAENLTAQVEGIQAVIWHLLVAHPALRKHQMRWESLR